jgi:hypothetical protein
LQRQATERVLARARQAALARGDLPIMQQLAALLSGATLEDDPGVGTLRVRARARGRPHISVAPDFAARFLRSREDALHLVLHEAMHPLLADELPGGAQLGVEPAVDLAFEVEIARRLAGHGFASPPPYWTRLYLPDRLPDALLLRPRTLLRARVAGGVKVRLRAPAAIERSLGHAGALDASALAAMYLAAWQEPAPLDQRIDAWRTALLHEEASIRWAPLVLLGTHDASLRRSPRQLSLPTIETPGAYL